ncbi:hypothetical protein JN531_009350 [Flagellatimonas centrodinii]|uniref:hypothetical protein n=1 Tax=Flagellatimonas centrodinii TaxID=2806210 RepID=UPI001FEE7C2A|nr:hypothetical protein [Flagellatimonas centrodinii]ULQ45333.1 hypothetical protein JN531_009350 [Flagellatimonas centrodinii]
MIFRLLLIAAAAWIVWRLAGIALRQLEQRSKQAPPDATEDDPPFVPMTRCSRCGTHLPRTDVDDDGCCTRCSGS